MNTLEMLEVVEHQETSVREEEVQTSNGKGSDVCALPPRKKIWIDLDNSPHVPFFIPIIKELEKRGFSILLTARDAFQVSELIRLHGLKCRSIGRHYGKHTIAKIFGLAVRVLQLLPIAAMGKPHLAVAHCSRAQAIACMALRIPTLWISDYEFAKGLPFLKVDWLLVPEVIPSDSVGLKPDRVLKYPGIKEDVYVPTFQPNASIRAQLGLHKDHLVVTMRPPAEEAHYHSRRSDELFRAAMDYLSEQSQLRVVILPRNDRQGERIRRTWPGLFETGQAIVPSHAVDGLNLIWHSDLVISGGGTMNREAAALGVPVYSIFGGTIGAVDKYLAGAGRLTLLETPHDVRTKIQLVHRDLGNGPTNHDHAALTAIVENIVKVSNGCTVN